MDVLTKEQRKKNMQNIRSKDTKIEVLLRKSLRTKGIGYRKNYNKLLGNLKKYKNEVTDNTETVPVEVNKEELIKKLKDFRWCQSKYENIKPYYIFNDMQMNDLIEKNPKNEEELLQVSGFGKVKVDKYGKDILKILSGK